MVLARKFAEPTVGYGDASIGLVCLMLPHCLAERYEALMTELIERYRHAGSGIVATSATLITLVGCIALFLQSRLGSMHYPRLVLTTNLTFERVIWVAWFALGVSLLFAPVPALHRLTFNPNERRLRLLGRFDRGISK